MRHTTVISKSISTWVSVGLFLLGGFLIASYRKICRRLAPSSLRPAPFAVWTIMLFYDVTEAGFRSGLIWLTFLMVAIAVPERVSDKALAFPISACESVGRATEVVPQHFFERESCIGK